jgi:predicted branched-subunit amino acid permease
MNHHHFREGNEAATPIVLGYLPVALALQRVGSGGGVSPLRLV